MRKFVDTEAMSRIIVKGLPNFLTEDDKLKEHFVKRLIQSHGNKAKVNDLITDVKIVKDKNGKTRRFAFVGYREEADAFDAADYFDGSYINTSKIEVSIAKSFADPRVPQPMKEQRRQIAKRLREKEEALLLEEQNTKKSKFVDKKKMSIDAEIEKNRQLQEFIQTMKPSSQVASWETPGLKHDIQETEQDESAPGNSLLAHALALKEDSNLRENDSDDEYADLNSNKLSKEDNVDEEMVSLDAFSRGADEITEEAADNLARDENVTDLEWFKQRRVRIKDNGEIVEKSSVIEKLKDIIPATEEDQQDSNVEEPEDKKSEEERAIEKINETGRLFLRNILYSSSEAEFKNLFGAYGELEEVHIALDTRTGQSKGFAYILFKDPKNAVNAYIELDKQIFQGRLLHILPADAKKDHRLDEFDLKNMPLKKQKELKRKAAASRQTFSWNSLYMNQDAVLGSVAAKLGLQKSQLIDPENSNSAVKQALAEAHVIGDVRKYFETKGVDLAKFAQMKSNEKRDDRVILVKNFPFGTTIEELGDLFIPFGKLERFLMPPAGTIAILQYRDITSARAAFSKLAYKRFKDSVIYLEKGPSNCFTRDANNGESLENADVESTQDIKEAKKTSHDIMQAEPSTHSGEDTRDDVTDGPTVSIFIKNLNFSTTTQQLMQKFKSYDGFVVAQVKTKPDPKDSKKTLSMGFGFAEFRTKEQALAVISTLDGSVLEGHKIQLKLSHRQGKTSGDASRSKRIKSGKIIVKNLPFEATRKDVFELFSSFGNLKSVRVPKKFDKSARGFAFVEFLLPKEAESAMDQLQGVHLLGRRLVMQFAQEEAQDAEEEITRMTKKMQKQAATRELAAIKSNGGRRRLEMESDENDGLNGM